MKTFAQIALAGFAGFVTLKVVAALLLPLLGLAAGIFSAALKLLVLVLVGWCVLKLLRGGKRRAEA